MKFRPFSFQKISRRTFLKYGFRLLPLTLAGAGFDGHNNIRVEKLRLRYSDLPPAFDGYRIVQISDLHAGFWVSRRYLNRVVDQMNRMPKDLLAATGDFISGADRFHEVARNDMKMVSEVPGRVKHTPFFGVLGNHDQMDGPKAERRMTGLLENAGMRMLRNQTGPAADRLSDFRKFHT